MRRPSYLSYTGLTKWEKSPDKFYLDALCPNRIDREPQERPAAVGSAFDARVKSELSLALYGSVPENSYAHLFESQVEPQNRDWAGPEGDYVFECYKQSGFYRELLDQISAGSDARFEFTLNADIEGVPFMGKPDVHWYSKRGVSVVHDFKVNGYCGKTTTSPHKSYKRCRDGFVADKQSRSHDTEHKEFLSTTYLDVIVNASYLEVSHSQWADQLSLYGFALGEKIGDENVVMSIHQIVAKPTGYKSQLRIAEFVAKVSASHQRKLVDRLKACWSAVESGLIFPGMSLEECQDRCAILDRVSAGAKTVRGSYFEESVKEQYRG